GLHKAPASRPSAAALAGRLDQFLAGRVELVSTTALPTVRETVSRRRGVLLLVGLAALLVAGAVGLWAALRGGKTTDRDGQDVVTKDGRDVVAPVGEPAPLTGELVVRVWGKRR